MSEDIRIKIHDSDEKELYGYELLESGEVKCENCDQVLLNVIKVKESTRFNRIKAKCPDCNEDTFYYKIEGEIFIAPPHNSAFAVGEVQTEFKESEDHPLIVVNNVIVVRK